MFLFSSFCSKKCTKCLSLNDPFLKHIVPKMDQSFDFFGKLVLENYENRVVKQAEIFRYYEGKHNSST